MRDDILDLVRAGGPGGLAAEDILNGLTEKISRATLNRHLAALREGGLIKSVGQARATRYVTTSSFSRADIDAYFARPAASRPYAPFREAYLEPQPNIDRERAARCVEIQGLANPMDRKYLAAFLVDFSWGSSILEGSTYSELDTEALITYGQRAKDKPVEDAFLALNHKRAGEHLWTHRALSVENLCAMHALLTDDHGREELAESDHFLPIDQRGVTRVFNDVNLQNSAYLPPFRPGTDHARELLDRIVATAQAQPAVEAAVYLLTRVAYVQSFSNGNKRTSRLAANIPLLAEGLIPFSFADVNKADYIRGMAAFYELGSVHVIEQTFIEGYVRSVIRSSNLPASLRTASADPEVLAGSLVEYVNTGKRPASASVATFLRAKAT
ncbi:Fic family protein [Roseateles amylovorans]|uniref:Fic family protein n=1 Tax=Roseateles amylovorans TaxID=2978473 RepID=A0ABY6B518_9BURK|nr:Fic family protein [Roseateles amylovorans]UXH80339.1 Fic family protein [Roseateles amylovorans]